MIAFSIWAYDAGQDVGKVQSMLQERTGMLVPLEQIREWRSVGRWSEIFASVHQTLEGPTLAASKSMLTRATIKAVATIVSIMDNESNNANTRLRAAMTVLDRGGFPVLLRGESVADALSASSAYSDVTDDELEDGYASFNADDYSDRHSNMAAAVTINGYHASGNSILSR
jgi:hypothetical protein